MEALRDDSDSWVTDKDKLKNMATRYLKTLYSEEVLDAANSYHLKGVFPRLDHVRMRSIDADVTSEENKDALFSMWALKAPGPDGFHAMFFQNQWDIIGNSVCTFIKNCFRNPSKIDDINDTDVILIPKKDNPNTIKQFRPIALYNVIYKVITKIIANRLKPLLADLISPTQCIFVSGRHSSDNVIIAHEIIHSMANKKWKKGFITIKVDLEKAYDVSTGIFFRKLLKILGFRILWSISLWDTSLNVAWGSFGTENLLIISQHLEEFISETLFPLPFCFIYWKASIFNWLCN